jgi:hypothetical protein
MYLVDLGFGKETLFRSRNELSAAIRQGVVGHRSRIYHRTRAIWLPITAHPEFRRLAGEHPDPRLMSGQDQWTFMPAQRGADPEGPDSTHPVSPAIMPRPARSWRQSLGSAFRFWGKGH